MLDICVRPSSARHVTGRGGSSRSHLCVEKGLVFSDIFALMAKAAMIPAAGSEMILAKADTRESSTSFL